MESMSLERHDTHQIFLAIQFLLHYYFHPTDGTRNHFYDLILFHLNNIKTPHNLWHISAYALYAKGLLMY